MLNRIIDGWYQHCDVNALGRKTKKREEHLIAYLNGAKIALAATMDTSSDEFQSFAFFCYLCSVRGESYLTERAEKLKEPV